MTERMRRAMRMSRNGTVRVRMVGPRASPTATRLMRRHVELTTTPQLTTTRQRRSGRIQLAGESRHRTIRFWIWVAMWGSGRRSAKRRARGRCSAVWKLGRAIPHTVHPQIAGGPPTPGPMPLHLPRGFVVVRIPQGEEEPVSMTRWLRRKGTDNMMPHGARKGGRALLLLGVSWRHPRDSGTTNLRHTGGGPRRRLRCAGPSGW
jgi:hypothetical protein